MPQATQQVNEGGPQLPTRLCFLATLPGWSQPGILFSASDALPATSSVFAASQFTCHLLQEVFLGSTSRAVGT